MSWPSSFSSLLSYDIWTISSGQHMNIGQFSSDFVLNSDVGLSDLIATFSSRVGSSGCEVSYWSSSSSLRCKVSGGSGSFHRVSVTSSLLVGSLTRALTYEAPFVWGVQSLIGDSTEWFKSTDSFSNQSMTGILTIFGYNFGKDDFTPLLKVGASSCSAVRWYSETAISCSVAPAVWNSSCSTSSCRVDASVEVSVTGSSSSSLCEDDLEWRDSNGFECKNFTENAEVLAKLYQCGFSGGVITSDAGTIMDGYDDYSNNQECEFVISPIGARQISLYFTEFLTESDFDRLFLYSCEDSSCTNSTLIVVLHGALNISTQIFSTVPGHTAIKAVFVSDFSNVAKGFSANFYSDISSTWIQDPSLWYPWCDAPYAESLVSPGPRQACCACRGLHYLFECPQGYMLTGYYQGAEAVCQDVNECATGACDLLKQWDPLTSTYEDRRGQCVNTIGSYSCTCSTDYTTACSDIAIKSAGSWYLVQEALDGATIYVSPGLYQGVCGSVLNRNITIVGIDGAENTVFDCLSQSSFVTIESATVTLRGLTIRNGRNATEGGCLSASHSSVTLIDVALQ
eukprot:37320-Hanusia_phi.AAC.1